MKYYIAADGGGTKVQAVLYDEELRMVSAARVSGVNSNFRPVEHIAAEMHKSVLLYSISLTKCKDLV